MPETRKMGETIGLGYELRNAKSRKPSRIPVLVSSPIVRHRARLTTQSPQRPSATATEIRSIEVMEAPIQRMDPPQIETERQDDSPSHQTNQAQPPSRWNPKKIRQSVLSIESRNDPTPEDYLDRISVCGVHNYLHATTTLERRFWIFVFVLATGGTLSYLVPAFQQYLSFTTVWDIQHRTQPNMKLPSPYVCVWAMNFTYFRAKFESVYNQTMVDKRLIFLANRIGRQLAKRNPAYWANRTYDSETFLKNTLEYMAAGVVGDTQWIDDIQHEYMDEAIARSIDYMGALYDGDRSFYDYGTFDCPTVLRNCTLNGKPIDCCRDSAVGTMVDTSKCFKFDIQRELADLNLTKSDQRITLSFETIMDSQFAPSSDIMYRGPMEVNLDLQNHMPSGWDASDVAVAAGTVSLVTVSGKLKRQMFNCIEKYQYNPKFHADAHPLVQEYFMHMTQPGRYNPEECAEGKMTEKLSITCGCVPYFKAIQPNDSIICTPSQIYACMHAAMQPDGADESEPQNIATKIDVWHNLSVAIDEECIPLCETWSYDAAVSSLDAEGDAGDVSQFYRSKVTIEFEPEYIVEEEVLQMDYHALIATIGDDLGLIFGMSFITFVQIAYWCVEAIRIRRRLGRVNVAR